MTRLTLSMTSMKIWFLRYLTSGLRHGIAPVAWMVILLILSLACVVIVNDVNVNVNVWICLWMSMNSKFEPYQWSLPCPEWWVPGELPWSSSVGIQSPKSHQEFHKSTQSCCESILHPLCWSMRWTHRWSSTTAMKNEENKENENSIIHVSINTSKTRAALTLAFVMATMRMFSTLMWKNWVSPIALIGERISFASRM